MTAVGLSADDRCGACTHSRWRHMDAGHCNVRTQGVECSCPDFAAAPGLSVQAATGQEEADVTTPSQEGRPEEEALRPLSEAATPGPWSVYDRGVGFQIALDDGVGDCVLPEGFRTDLARREDAEFIAAAANYVRDLLAAVVVSSPATPPDGWFTFGSHVDQASWLSLEFSDATDEVGDPLWERPVPASPATPDGRRCPFCDAVLPDHLDECDDSPLHAASPATPNGQEEAPTPPCTCNPLDWRASPTCAFHNPPAPSTASPAETREGRAAERLRRMQDVVHDDLSDLLRALGMGTHARPYSSHELMQEAIAKVRDLSAAASPAAVPLPEEEAP